MFFVVNFVSKINISFHLSSSFLGLIRIQLQFLFTLGLACIALLSQLILAQIHQTLLQAIP